MPATDIPLETTEDTYPSRVVCDLVGVTYRQLDYWDRTGVVTATGVPSAGSGYYREYTFEDTVEVANDE